MTLIKDRETVMTEREAMRQAGHQLRIEGLKVTDFATDLFKQLERHELTVDEVRAKLIAHHQKVVLIGNQYC
jgi:Antitoxin VbhA